MKKKNSGRWVLPVVVILLLFGTAVKAQYTTALGVRVGGTNGLTVKHKFETNVAIEGILGTFGNGFSLTGLLEKQHAINVEGLFIYYGGGVHIASYDGSTYENFGRDINTKQTHGLGFGVDGIFGLEYRLPNNIPIAFAIDTKPFVEVGAGKYVGFAFDPSFALKFVLK